MMEDELLSNVTWAESGHRWTGVINLANGKTAAFDIDIEETAEALPEAALNSLKFVAANEALISYRIAASMIELYQDWNDGKTITPEELVKKINLADVAIWYEGGGRLSYTAGDLFAGHWICVFFEADGEIGEPDLEG
jgi:hypothetical protein